MKYPATSGNRGLIGTAYDADRPLTFQEEYKLELIFFGLDYL
jgi:hypothetical protein